MLSPHVDPIQHAGCSPHADLYVHEVMAVDSRGYTITSTFAVGHDEIAAARAQLAPLAARVGVMPLAPTWMHLERCGLPADTPLTELRDTLIARKEMA